MHALFYLMVMSKPDPTPTTPTQPAEALIERWVELAGRAYPELAKPIARAMAQRAARGPLGAALRQLDEGLLGLTDSALPELTGSELQMLAAILQQLNAETSQLLNQISMQWQNA